MNSNEALERVALVLADAEAMDISDDEALNWPDPQNTDGQPNLTLGDLRALLAAIEAMGASAWQPIETAPKDGEAVLLFLPDAAKSQIDIGFWTDWNDGSGNWSSEWTDQEIDCEATYWQPLPEPPETSNVE